MMSLRAQLPRPHQAPLEEDFPSEAELSSVSTSRVLATTTAPPYGHRKGWVPRREEDFGDGGAFPEIHVAQYPLGMGRQEGDGAKSKALAQTLDADGKVRYDAIARQGHAKDRVVYSKLRDMMPKRVDEEELQKPDEEEVEETRRKTQEALDMLVEQKLAAAAPVRRADKQAPAQYIRYTPSNQGVAFNSGAKQRVVRMVEAQRDPMEPPKFKINKKIPRGPPSPPAPVMHSPNRKVTAKEQQEWKIPPCISNWKNLKGYTIPLDKRVAADGRGLQSVHINENFAKLAEALYIAERKAREAVEMRSQIEKKVAQREREKREEQLLRIAQQAREALPGGIGAVPGGAGGPIPGSGAGNDDERDRDDLRRERARERARDRNLARASHETRTKVARERERDITEQLALGTGGGARAAARGPDAMFDQRLFNQSRGMDSGFAGGEDELYNVYDRPWKPGGDRDGSHIYRPKKQADDESYGDELEKLSKQRRFVADKGFTDSDRLRRLDGPVQFEKDEEDPFGLNKFLSEAKKAQKRPNASGAGANDSGPSRKRDHRGD